MQFMMQISRSAIQFIQKCENILLALAAIISTVGVCIDVFCRYVLLDPMLGTEEVVRYLQIFMTFFGLAAVVRLKSHINLDILSDLQFFKRREVNLRVLGMIVELIGVLICIFLARLSYNFFHLGFSAGVSAAAGIPLVIPYSFLLLGFSLASVHHAVNFIMNMMDLPRRAK